MASFVEYPSTPAFAPFRKDYTRRLHETRPEVVDSATFKRLPRRGTYLGTVKLHGTNATIVFANSDAYAPQFQSRSRVIDSKTDNCGTVAHLSRAPLHELVAQILAIHGAATFSELIVAGEMAGKGIQKGVAIAHVPRFFAIFNIRIDGAWVDMRRYKSVALHQHRVFNVAAWPTFEINITPDDADACAAAQERIDQLTNDVVRACPVGAVLADEAQPVKVGQSIVWAGEGIVWTLVESLDEDVPLDMTELLNFKTKGEAFKTTARAPRLAPDANAAARAGAFAQYALAERRFEQGIEFLEQELVHTGTPDASPYQIQLIAKFAKWVMEDALKEERLKMEEMGVEEKLAKKALFDVAKAWYAAKVNAVG